MASKDLTEGIIQDFVKFHNEQWRFYETQRQWLFLAFITFSGVLTSSFFSSGTRQTLLDLVISPKDFLIFVIAVDVFFCLFCGLADAKFARLAAGHERRSGELVEGVLEFPELAEHLRQELRMALLPRAGKLSISAATYAGAIGVNMVILKVFVLKQSVGAWFFVAAFVVVLIAMSLFSVLRNHGGRGNARPPTADAAG